MWPHVGTNRNVFLDQISAERLFRCLNSNDRNTLQSIKKNIHLATATTIFYSGERPLQIFIHRSGWAVLWPDRSCKRAVHTAEVGSEMIYGLIEVLSGSTFDVSMTGLAESEFETIERDDFLHFICDQPALCFRLIKILSHLYQQTLHTIQSTDI